MIRAFLAVVLTVLAIGLSPARAQEPVLPNYDTWDRIATQTEQLAGSDDTTAEQLNDMRARIVDWRSQFQDAQGVNGDRIATVESQIAALGPAPAEGATEPDDIAASVASSSTTEPYRTTALSPMVARSRRVTWSIFMTRSSNRWVCSDALAPTETSSPMVTRSN